MNIIAVEDEALALDCLVDAVSQAAPWAAVRGFSDAGDALAFAQTNCCSVAEAKIP